MWDFRCPQLAGWAGSLLPEQPNCQGNQTAPTLYALLMILMQAELLRMTPLVMKKMRIVE